MRVLTRARHQTTNSRGSNGFGLRAYTGEHRSRRARTITGATNYSANCPQVHAVSDMSIFANLDGDAPPTSTSPRSIRSTRARRCASTCSTPVRVRAALQILDPERQPADVLVEHAVQPTDATDRVGCSGTAAGPIRRSTCRAPGPSRTRASTSTSKYNDRFITIDIPLPCNYTTVYGGKMWWKVRYNVGIDVDRPHHLVGQHRGRPGPPAQLGACRGATPATGSSHPRRCKVDGTCPSCGRVGRPRPRPRGGPSRRTSRRRRGPPADPVAPLAARRGAGRLPRLPRDAGHRVARRRARRSTDPRRRTLRCAASPIGSAANASVYTAVRGSGRVRAVAQLG